MTQPDRHDDAERAVLGSILLVGELYPRVAKILRTYHFASEQHRTIYAVMGGLWAKEVSPDFVTVTCELDHLRELDKAGGAAYITGLGDKVPDVENVMSYASQVIEYYLERRFGVAE